jgi:hypothetical protein
VDSLQCKVELPLPQLACQEECDKMKNAEPEGGPQYVPAGQSMLLVEEINKVLQHMGAAPTYYSSKWSKSSELNALLAVRQNWGLGQGPGAGA